MSALLMLLAALAPPAATPATPRGSLVVDEGRADRAPARASQSTAPAEAAPPRETVEADAPATVIRDVAYGGATPPPVVSRAAAPFIGQPASAAVLARLARALSDGYARSDIALYNVSIPNQPLADGVVHVVMAEGFIEQVRIKGRTTPLLTLYAKALTDAPHPLSRIIMERYVSLIRAIPGATVIVAMAPGSRPGGVILDVDIKRRGKEITLLFDNRGVARLGNAQLRAELHGYSLLRDGDDTTLYGIATPTSDRLRYVGITHTTPIGHAGATLTASAGYIRTHARKSLVHGNARTGGLALALPIVKGYRRNLTATLGVDGVDSDAAVLGAVISQDHTRAARASLGYWAGSDNTAFTAGLTLSRGLDAIGARGNPILTDLTFSKLSGRITYDRQVGKHFYGRLRVAGQYSEDRLPAAELFTLGGQDFGRAFETGVIGGDSGYAGLGEFAWRPKLPKAMEGSELYAFADTASIRIIERYPYAGGDFDLASAGAGIRLNYTSRAAFELEAARVIDRPYAGYQGRDWRVNIGWRLSLAKR